MRRRAGVGAIQKQRLEQEKYREKGSEIQENQFQQMSKQLEVFRENLEEFASKHKSEIKKNAQFRRQFQEMCAAIGVDPLASGKGFWFTVVPIGKGKWLVQSVPGELNLDQTLVLQKASTLGTAWVSTSILTQDLSWNDTRAENALNHMVKEGLAWVDTQDPKETLYWFPSMFAECVSASEDAVSTK
ncbi:jg17883 [Pararge aegeria aegeria]|uniref:Vacuolar-sorting protein SNF8 n=1 Tax=Pararge aegeria aegeria TaxID=348720 RepID=A0A8S4SKD5_9NEOP|nr:jg17883 [Pararge aegeria aegeria]